MKVPGFLTKSQTLRRKLLQYMLLLAALLVLLCFLGMYLLGGLTGVKQELSDTLRFQAQVFGRQLSAQSDGMAVMSVQLSENMAEGVETYLDRAGIPFSSMAGSETHIAALEDSLMEPLRHKLLETNCTGAYVVLFTHVNPNVKNADVSRSGLYIQRGSLDSTDPKILLFRGLSDVGKRYGLRLHERWKLEFDISNLPDFEAQTQPSSAPLGQRYRISEIMALPGTSERVMLSSIPILAPDGSLYGLCGFEISESQFRSSFAQPSELPRVLFCLSPGSEGLSDAADCFSAGVAGSYYLAPNGQFTSEPFGRGLRVFRGQESAYVGVSQGVSLSASGGQFSLSVLMPKQDYDRRFLRSTLRVILLAALLAATAVFCCLYFTRRYISPIKKSLAQIQQKQYSAQDTTITEIADLFAFLAAQDRAQEAAISQMEQEKSRAQASLAQMQTAHAQASQRLERLAYSRKNEIDPDDYAHFRSGIRSLTKTERKVFDYYLQGKTVKEIVEIMGVKESTIRFHNRNIYTTLGVNSLKQMLRYAAILAQEEPDSSAQPKQ